MPFIPADRVSPRQFLDAMRRHVREQMGRLAYAGCSRHDPAFERLERLYDRLIGSFVRHRITLVHDRHSGAEGAA